MSKVTILLIFLFAIYPPAFSQTNTICAAEIDCTEPTNWSFVGNSATLATARESLLTAKQVDTVLYVDAGNTEGWSGSDVGAWINSAQTALPMLGEYRAGVINLSGLAGTSPIQTSEVVVSSPYVSIVGPGKGLLTFRCVINEPCWDTRINKFGISPSGYIGGFTIVGQGTSNANAVGIEAGDRIGGEFHDIAIDNFLGKNSAAIWLNNTNGFFERDLFTDIELGLHGDGSQDGNTKNIRITNSGGPDNNSFEYDSYYGIRMTVQSGETGWSVEGSTNPPFISGNNWEGSSNLSAGGTLFSFTGTVVSQSAFMENSNIWWGTECTGCVSHATRFNVASNIVVAYSGQVNSDSHTVDSVSGYLENTITQDASMVVQKNYGESRTYNSGNVAQSGMALTQQNNLPHAAGPNIALTSFNAKGIWGVDYVGTYDAEQYWCLSNGSPSCTERMRLTPSGLQLAGHLNQSSSGTFASVCTFSSSTKCTVVYSNPFTSTPIVILTPVNPGSTNFTLTSSSSSGFTITASGKNSVSVNWLAVGNPN